MADEPAALSAGFCAALDDAVLPDWSVLAEAISPEGVVALAVVSFSSLVYVLVEGSLYRDQDAALTTRGDDRAYLLVAGADFRF